MGNQYLLRVFGNTELIGPRDTRVPLNTRRQLGVLAYLVLEAKGSPVRRETLVELFWPDAEAERGRHSLTQAVFDLRQALGRESLVTRGATVELQVPVVTELEGRSDDPDALAELGDPLLGMEDLGGSTLSHWLDAIRAGLRTELRALLHTGLLQRRADGDMVGLRKHARVLYRTDPLSDDAVLALAEDELLSGAPAEAIHLLRTHIARVRDACGEEPGREIARLLRRVEDEAGPAVVATPQVSMFGRDDEIGLLESVWSTIRHGGSTAALITGPPGIGKTTLIDSFSHSIVTRHWPCYSVRCHEMGKRIPYSAISNLVHLLSREPQVGATDPGLLAEASRVAPELRVTYPGVPETPHADPDSIRLRVAGAIYQMFFEVLDAAPALIAFDDIHNMDQASRDVLYVLFHRMRSQAVMFLASSRSPHDGEVVSRSDVMEWGCLVELKPLERARSRELLDAIAGDMDSSTLERILELGQDNPHLIEILVNDTRENGDESLARLPDSGGGWQWQASRTMKRALARLLYGLDSAAQRLLDVISIAERPISIADAAAITGVPEKEADAAGYRLIERGLVRFEVDGFSIKNELHRFYIHSRMNPDIRRFLHARVARHVSAASPQEFDSSLELVHHLLEADSIDEAVAMVVEAASQAIESGAPAEAERAIRAAGKAIDVGEHWQLSLLLGKALVALGEYRPAIRVLERLQGADPNGEEDAEAKRLLAEAMLRGGDLHDTGLVRLAREAYDTARNSHDGIGMAGSLQVLAEYAFQSDDRDLFSFSIEQAKSLALTADDSATKGKALTTIGFHHLVCRRLDDAIRDFTSAEEILRSQPPDTGYRRVLNGLGICYTGTGDLAAAEDALKRSIEVSEGIGDQTGIRGSYDNLGYLWMEQGRYSDALKCYQRYLQGSKRHFGATGLANYCANGASLALVLGQPDRALRLVALAQESRDVLHWRESAKLLIAQSDVHLAGGNYSAAWSCVDELESIITRHSSAKYEDIGQIGRLRRHFVYSTRGWDALLEFLRGVPDDDYMRVTNRIEMRITEAWARWDAGFEDGRKAVDRLIEEASELGVYGLLARTHAVGVLPVSRGDIEPGESSAQFVARVLGHQSLDFPPESIFEKLQSVEQRCSS